MKCTYCMHMCDEVILCKPCATVYSSQMFVIVVKFYSYDICFLLGKYKLLQCLLSIHQILNSAEPYYILNNLYISDYCVWIQHVKSEVIQSLADDLDKVNGTLCV